MNMDTDRNKKLYSLAAYKIFPHMLIYMNYIPKLYKILFMFQLFWQMFYYNKIYIIKNTGQNV